MKKYFYLFLVLVASVAFTACNNNEDPAGRKDYVVVAKLHYSHVKSGDAEASAYLEKLNAILKKNQCEPGKSWFAEATDTADLGHAIDVLGQKIKAEAGPCNFNCYVNFVAVEKRYANEDNDKEHPWEVIRILKLGASLDVDYVESFDFADNTGNLAHADAYAYGFDVTSSKTDRPTNCYGPYLNMNCNAGGDDIYLYMITSGPNVWDPSRSYITDVIVIYGGGEPSSIVIEGRTYHKAVGKDLNKHAHGEYIYLYTTTDYYDGRYLWVGGYHPDWDYRSSRVHFNDELPSKDFSVAEQCLPPFNNGTYDIVERFVKAYDTSGNYVGEAEFNKGAGGAYIKMVMAYRKH